MTDPKPATPDHEILVLQGRITLALQRISAGYAPMRIPAQLTDPDLVLSDCAARIASDAETNRKQAEEIERLKGDLQEAKHFSSMLTAALENRNEELKDLANRLKHRCFRYHIEDGVQLAKELAQVETLREALTGVLPGVDDAWALWPDGRDAVLKARAAIAATEPKG